jgi:hypothetical protein
LSWVTTAEILEIFQEAQELAVQRVLRRLRMAHQAKLQQHRDYYTFVRTSPRVRAKENAAISGKRCAARDARAEQRSPCPQCGGEVTRGAKVPRGRKLPKFCSPTCARRHKLRAYYWRCKVSGHQPPSKRSRSVQQRPIPPVEQASAKEIENHE